MSSSSDNLKVFNPNLETVEEFLQRFKVQHYEVLLKAGENSTKRAMHLANALPVNILTDIQRRFKPKLLTEATFEDIENHLVSAFSVKKSVIGAAVSFVNRKQKPSESIETYSKVLNELASQCDYSDCCRDRLLRDIFISGLRSPKLIRVLITECEQKKFSECVARAKVLEQVTQDVQDINPGEKVQSSFKIERVTNKDGYHRKNHDHGSVSSKKTVPSTYKCIRCGSKAKHFVTDCYALKLKCNKCRKPGHIAQACKTKQSDAKSNYVAAEEEDPAQYIAVNNVSRDYHSESPRYKNEFPALKNRFGALSKMADLEMDHQQRLQVERRSETPPGVRPTQSQASRAALRAANENGAEGSTRRADCATPPTSIASLGDSVNTVQHITCRSHKKGKKSFFGRSKSLITLYL